MTCTGDWHGVGLLGAIPAPSGVLSGWSAAAHAGTAGQHQLSVGPPLFLGGRAPHRERRSPPPHCSRRPRASLASFAQRSHDIVFSCIDCAVWVCCMAQALVFLAGLPERTCKLALAVRILLPCMQPLESALVYYCSRFILQLEHCWILACRDANNAGYTLAGITQQWENMKCAASSSLTLLPGPISASQPHDLSIESQ